MFLYCDLIFYYILGFIENLYVQKRDFNKHMYSVFIKLDIRHVILSTDGYRYIERVFLSWCTNILDIHGNFNELLDLLFLFIIS